MEQASGSLREQGAQALRDGNVERAVDLLSRAVLADGQDADAQAMLGVAYSQKGLHAQAKRALQTAAELRPQEARYHFSFGVALEQANELQNAAAAYRRALQVNPSYEQARAKLQALTPRLQGAAGPAPAVSGSGGPAPTAATSWLGGAPSSEAPSQGSAASSQTPWLVGKTPAPPPLEGPHGTVQCPSCKQWSKPGLSCEWCSAPLRQAPASSGGTAPWLTGGYGAGAAEPGPQVSLAPDMSAGEAFGRRWAASFIDTLLLVVVNEALMFMIAGSPFTAPQTPPDLAAAGTRFVTSMAVSITTTILYAGGLLALRGQTLGKMALGLRVVGPDGGKPSFGRAVLRETVGKFISGIIMSLGYLWMLWDEQQQTWHDKIASTTVERA